MPGPRRILAGALVALIFASGAAEARIVVVTQSQIPQYREVIAGFKEILPDATVADLANAKELEAALGLDAEVLVAVGSKAFDMAKARPPRQTTLIAAAVLGADNNGRPDITAVPMETKAASALEALETLAPEAKQIVALYPSNSTHVLDEAKKAAKKSRRTVDFRPLSDLAGFQAFFLTSLSGHQAVWLLPDTRLARAEIVQFMIASCLDQRVALLGFLEGMTKAGALASVSADFSQIGREAARLAQDIAQRPKANRSGVPFRFASGKITVNERTRKALNLGGGIPAGAQVIE